MQFASYKEYKIRDTIYKVSSIFAGKGSLRDIYEKFIINSEKRDAICQHMVYNKRIAN